MDAFQHIERFGLIVNGVERDDEVSPNLNFTNSKFARR